MLSKRLDELGRGEIDDARDDRGKRWRLGTLLRASLGAMVAGSKSLAKVEELSERMSQPTRRCWVFRGDFPTRPCEMRCVRLSQTSFAHRSTPWSAKHIAEKALETHELPCRNPDHFAVADPMTDRQG